MFECWWNTQNANYRAWNQVPGIQHLYKQASYVHVQLCVCFSGVMWGLAAETATDCNTNRLINVSRICPPHLCVPLEFDSYSKSSTEHVSQCAVPKLPCREKPTEPCNIHNASDMWHNECDPNGLRHEPTVFSPTESFEHAYKQLCHPLKGRGLRGQHAYASNIYI